MAKDPTHAFFECESCGHKTGTDARMAAHILPFKRKLPIEPNGHCRHCGGDRWTISAVYAESGVDIAESALGIGLAATTGLGFIQRSTHSSHLIYRDVPAAAVAHINEHPKDRLARLGEFVRTMERAKLKDAGGRACPSCGALFVPAAGNTWHQAGYCSKVCMGKTAPGAVVKTSTARDASPRRVAAITAHCPSGHQFEVPASFAGMVRPCPQCGAKTAVVDQSSIKQTTTQTGGFSTPVSGRDGERLVLKFVADVQSNHYRGRIVEFTADRELPPKEKELAFRNLERIVTSQLWRPAFTSIDVVNGIEDSVTVYLRGAAGAWVALSAVYHYDVNQWQLDSYETSQRSFARPADESFEDYVHRSMAQVKSVGRQHPGGVAGKDGQYFMEY